MSLLSEHEESGRLICFKHFPDKPNLYCPDYVFLRVNDDDTGWLVGRYHTLRNHITYKPCYHHLGTAIHSYMDEVALYA